MPQRIGWRFSNLGQCQLPERHATFCMSVRMDGRGRVYDGSAWGNGTLIDDGVRSTESLDWVSCPTPTFCMDLNVNYLHGSASIC